jgi:hypothetical protein
MHGKTKLNLRYLTGLSQLPVLKWKDFTRKETKQDVHEIFYWFFVVLCIESCVSFVPSSLLRELYLKIWLGSLARGRHGVPSDWLPHAIPCPRGHTLCSGIPNPCRSRTRASEMWLSFPIPYDPAEPLYTTFADEPQFWLSDGRKFCLRTGSNVSIGPEASILTWVTIRGREHLRTEVVMSSLGIGFGLGIGRLSCRE